MKFVGYNVSQHLTSGTYLLKFRLSLTTVLIWHGDYIPVLVVPSARFQMGYFYHKDLKK